MGRMPVRNPKNKILNFKVTEEDYMKFKSLGFKGDRGIQILIHRYGNNQKMLEIEKYSCINRIKKIDKEIQDLEYEKLAEQSKLEDINYKLGYREINGKVYSDDVMRAVDALVEKYRRKSIGDIFDFISDNERIIRERCYMVNISFNEMKELLINQV